MTIHCLKCTNCDLMNDCCKVYGPNPVNATSKCAKDGFKNYHIKRTRKKAEEKKG